ncbi:hypothetical protein LY76DRAFT_252017 [Colletotrichum caudatum]|nr:hypothetical protein LY76DRAFT_252017 [Colletotrichum caudatum]
MDLFFTSSFGNFSLFIRHHFGRSLQHIRALGITTTIPGVRQKFDYHSHVTPLHDSRHNPSPLVRLVDIGLQCSDGHLTVDLLPFR